MPATLQQIQTKLAEATALRDLAAEAMPLVVAAGGAITAKIRSEHEARLNGYQREVELLLKCERDLIANGRLDAESDWLTEARFNAPGAVSAVLTPSDDCDASQAPREAPRNEVSAAPLPAAGDVF
ncbi:hypothetical protein [Prosthecobacter sp.]|uniref:hypothetical protein n=1 Tax=Prosthecobacter sp. TaxID=1965333 RepID=UPI0037846095